MKPGKALHFLNQDPMWLVRALGLLTAVIIPPYRYMFPVDAIDPIWIRLVISGFMIALVTTTFLWDGIRAYLNTIIYSSTIVLSGWMLALAILNDLSPAYSISYFILVFTSLTLYRSWYWLLSFMAVNLICTLAIIFQMDTPLFDPWTFISMQGSIFTITILGLMKGFQEFDKISGREELLRNINRASFENSKTAILVTDAEGLVLHLNQLWLEMWPLDDPIKAEAQVSGMWMLRCQRLLTNPQVMLDISRLAADKTTNELIEVLYLIDGRVIELHAQTFEISANSHGWIWFFDDVTITYKNSERLKTSRQRLIRQNEALVYLASSDKSSFKNLDECFANITNKVAETLNTNRASIWRFDQETQSLSCQSVHFSEDDHCPTELEITAAKSPEYFRLLETERVIFIDNFDKNPLTSPFSLPEQNGRAPRSRVIIPLRSNSELYGILSAERIGSTDWEAEEQQFLASVGDLTMVAVEADERRKAVESGQKLTALLETVFELAGVGILVTSNERKLLNINKQYLSIWGMDLDFAMNSDPDEVIAFCRDQVLDESELSESMRFLLENPDQNDSKSLFFKDGRIVERFTEVLRNGDDVIGRVWFYRDVTTRLQAETKLIESEMRNKAILDAIPDLILRIDVAGKILDAKIPENSPFERLPNIAKDQNINNIFPKDFNQQLIAKSKLALSRAMLFEIEIEAQLFDSLGDYDLRVIQSGIDEVLVMIRDVTERKKTEKELVQRNHELDSFVYRASHDLKAPLNSLMGLIDILKSETPDPNLLMYVGLMDKSVIKLDTFIRNLTDFSKIARIEIQAKPVDFSNLIDDVTESLFFMENASNIEKVVEIKPGPVFIGDSFHIGIVLSNLISNAIKYTDSKKPSQTVKIVVQPEADQCIITVEDNGLGIPASYQNRIFELFFRASTQSFGSGLGLYITRNAIDKMKGAIEIESEEGKGTCFKVILPNLSQAQAQGLLAASEQLN